MNGNRLIEVDESLARAMRDEKLDGRMSLLDDLRGGIHAKAVISELTAPVAAGRRGEHSVGRDGDFEMRLTNVFHGAGFHQIAIEEGIEAWDDEDHIRFREKRFPHTRVRYVPRRTTLLMPGFAFKGSERLRNAPPAL